MPDKKLTKCLRDTSKILETYFSWSNAECVHVNLPLVSLCVTTSTNLGWWSTAQSAEGEHFLETYAILAVVFFYRHGFIALSRLIRRFLTSRNVEYFGFMFTFWNKENRKKL